ncbi:MAG: VOC family protein [Thiohalocapsa sp.]
MPKVAMRFGEVVLKTSQYEALKAWYSQVLDAKPMFESQRREDLGPGTMRQMCTIRPYAEFPFTETLVILDFAELQENNQTVSGMDHFQMQFGSIDDLFDRYEALAAHGIVPTRSANHGPATSFYYRDPDGNRVELSVKNYATEAETLAFMQSEAFRRNPAGIDVDPAEYVGRYRAGVPLEQLRQIPSPT